MNRKKKKIRPFSIFNYVFMAAVCFACIVPFINLLAISLSSAGAVEQGVVGLLPVNFTTSAYQFALNGQFPRSLAISVVRTALGTLISVILTMLTAYPLSRPDNKLSGRKYYVAFFIITMIFNGGIIPLYLVVSRMGLKNTIWSLVLPGALSVHNMLIMMNFIRALPYELEEAAAIDGASPIQVLIQVLLPLLKPAIATIALFYMVSNWNEWFHGMLFIKDVSNYPLQTYLRSLMENMEQLLGSQSMEEMQAIITQMNTRTARAAQMFLGALPIILVYPFLQKYFTKGLVIGSVKG